MKVLLFGGTDEGRALALWMAGKEISFTVSVATEYGAALLPAGTPVHVGRLDRAGMEALMGEGHTLVVDATHPYAAQATRTIRAAAAGAGLPCLRLLRPPAGPEGGLRARDMAQAAELLGGMPGNVLLTTGSKELHHFAVPGLVERCCPRVLPVADALARCLELGFPPGHIICMQGPFSVEMNLATLRQFDIAVLVTKDSGARGGFREKAEAARTAGCALLVVERPIEERGLSLEEVQAELTRRMEQCACI